jgi:hypothetical protein
MAKEKKIKNLILNKLNIKNNEGKGERRKRESRPSLGPIA